MGVTGLLPFLKKIHEPVNVGKFAGLTVAIDAYCWLHKGAFSCAEKLALGEKTDQYVYYCMKFINTLLAKNIKPVLVFDGCHLPSKKNVEKTRREKREMNRRKAAQFLREGRRAEARECLQRCIDISPEMALELMNVCRSKGVDCIVAPYEADAQLAYLNKIGVAQVVITEDSDLLLFGCEKVLFKMDHAGNGILIEKSRLNEVMELQTGHFTFDKFRYMCILSGCDYLPSLSGIGLAKANKVFKLARQSDLQQLLKKLSTYLKSNITVPQEYIDGFIQANNTFLHQLVYDPLQRKLVPLTPYPSDIRQEDVSYAGPHMSSDRAYQLALGNINIYTNEKFADYDPDTYVPKYVKKKAECLHLLSMWDRHYRIRPKPGLTEVQPCDRPVLKGKEIEVSAKFKRISPKKRLREAEDSNDVKTNSELSNLYVQHSPSKKRLKTEIVNDDLQRFMFSEGNNQSGESDNLSQEEEVENNKQKQDPKFFCSLSEAHLVAGEETEQQNSEDKENGVTSPRRNVFAFKSPSKKSRFDLNAARSQDVKSRFFAKTSNPIRLSNKLNNVPKMKSKNEETRTDKSTLNGYKLIHENTANVKVHNSPKNSTDAGSSSVESVQEDKDNSESENENTDTNDKETSGTNPRLMLDEVINSKPYSQSPTSAFNWGKFKFNTTDKSGSSVSSPVTKRSLSIFKRKSESNLERESSQSTLHTEGKRKIGSEMCSQPEDKQCDSNTSEIDCEENEVDKNGNSEIVNVEDSSLGSSYPYSIDTDCLPSLPEDISLDSQSQQSINSEGTNSQSSSNSIQRKKSGLNLYFKPAPVSDKAEPTAEPKVTIDDENTEVVFTASEPRNSNTDKCVSSQQSTPGSMFSQTKKRGLSIYFKPATSYSSDNTKDKDMCGDDEEKDTVTDTDIDGTDNTNAAEPDVVVIRSDDEDSDRNTKSILKQTKSKPFPLKSSRSQKGKGKSGCRVSGLSKKSKTLSEQDTDKQKSLKDMFSKFAHTKSLKQKISHEDDVVHTPESETSVLNKETRVQKHLLL